MLIEEHKLRVCGETVLRYIFGFESAWVRGTAVWGAALAVFVTEC
jgi:hypothetical protein